MLAGLTLRELDGNQFLANLEACAAVYAAAMNPPAEQMAGRHVIMERHAGYAAFRAVVAVTPAGGDGAGTVLIGFAYGFHGTGGQWWHDLVSRSAASELGTRAADDWFGDSLEVAEVHVLPDYQGQGTGLAMMLRLTAGRPERAAVLSTMDANTRARRLYHGLGFTDLLTGFEFPGTELRYAIMGAPLPLPGAAAGSARPGRPSRS